MNMKAKSKQKLPKWFDGDIYEEGAMVKNRFSGEEYELNNIELSMYDLVMGCSIMTEMGQYNDKIVTDLRKGLDWFRMNTAEAYMVLLD